MSDVLAIYILAAKFNTFMYSFYEEMHDWLHGYTQEIVDVIQFGEYPAAFRKHE